MRLHCILAVLILGLAVSSFLPAWAAETAAKRTSQEDLQAAQRALERGEWDKAEVDYLKALKSSQVEERIQAYEGLVRLYTKVKHLKKAALSQKQLEKEKTFKSQLVPQDSVYYTLYKIKKGDTYGQLAQRNFVSLEWLRRINGDKLLRVGDSIRIPKVSYTLTVDKVTKTLIWKRGGEVLKTYPIAIGREDMNTPEGEFTIATKVKNPVWYHLKQEIPPDSPENLLGTRWMGLNKKGYGIHGTRHPNSIGSAASHGCVRMFNQDVEELFQWIPIGTKVIIRSQTPVSK